MISRISLVNITRGNVKWGQPTLLRHAPPGGGRGFICADGGGLCLARPARHSPPLVDTSPGTWPHSSRVLPPERQKAVTARRVVPLVHRATAARILTPGTERELGNPPVNKLSIELSITAPRSLAASGKGSGASF
ncbi:hypothetical protein Bbelb_181700 [Branchiostoma belcheri]|nr:hypothetical protein Bbelb_181700 [Branchiostoma belcheri]